MSLSDRPPPRFGPRLVKQTFRHQHDQRRFVLAALCLPDKDDVIKLLSDGLGLERLRTLLENQYTIQAGIEAGRVSFQRIAVPLCELLTDPGFVNSTMATQRRKIYNTVWDEVLFLQSCQRCLQDMQQQQSVQDKFCHREANSYNPATWAAVVFPIAKLCLQLLTKVMDARADPCWSRLLNCVRDALLQAEAAGDPPEVIRRARDVLQRCTTIVNGVQQQPEAASNARDRAQVLRDAALAMSLQTGSNIPVEEEPPPGELRPEGPRHGNDHADFREIRVLPTEEEILCDYSPYLPHQSGPNAGVASEFVPAVVDRHLDIQFRLLREDMLAPVRAGIQAMIRENWLGNASGPTVSDFTVANRIDAKVRCVALRSMLVLSVVPMIHDGIAFRLQFNQPHAVWNKPANTVQHYWNLGSGSRMLQASSLVCLAFNLSCQPSQAQENDASGTPELQQAKAPSGRLDAGAARFVFAVVLQRGRDNLCTDRKVCSSLLVKAIDAKDADFLISQVHCPALPGCEHVLLQVRGHFLAASEPVLRSLQRQDISRLPFLERLVPHYACSAAEAGALYKPEYLSSVTTFDLSFLVTRGHEAVRAALRNCSVRDYDQLRADLVQHSDALVLDPSQIDAFVSGLTRDVALIQGPPGTGKTYVGVQLVHALLLNSIGRPAAAWTPQLGAVMPPADVGPRPALHPILCVCYTNHALDQFLVDLLAAKAVTLENVVRIGGRSKSETIQQCTLYSKEVAERSLDRSRTNRVNFFQLKDRCNGLEHGIAQCTKLLTSNDDKFKLKELGEYLKDSNQDLYVLVTGSDTLGVEDDADGDEGQFQIVGGFPAAVQRWREINSHVDDDGTGDIIDGAMQDMMDDTRERLQDLLAKYQATVEEVEENSNAMRLRVLRDAQVVACTTSGAAKYQELLHALRPRVVVCEEAGEVFEGHLLSTLTSNTQHLILIGDHLQLRPKASEYTLSVDSRAGFDLDVSLFERLVKQKKVPLTTLQVQRRMHERIADLARIKLYPNLADYTPVIGQYPEAPKGMASPVFFWDHSHPQDNNGSMLSHSNRGEASMVIALVRYFIRQGYQPNDVAVLTPYAGQLMVLRRLLRDERIVLFIDDRDLEGLDEVEDVADVETIAANAAVHGMRCDGVSQSVALQQRVRLATVDNFQGEEAKIVIISTVRCNQQGRTGFLKIENRVNVMLTRAKHGMYLLGSTATIRADKKAVLFSRVLDCLEKNECVGPLLPLQCQPHGARTLVRDAQDIPRDGGCGQPCQHRRACGHACARMCHADDQRHAAAMCEESCMRLIEQCGHPCPLLCQQPCGGCTVPVTKALACNHDVTAPCHMWYADAPPQCRTMVTTVLTCGHELSLRCGESRSLSPCEQECGLSRLCGHKCRSQCHMCPDRRNQVHAGTCQESCGRTLMCGHRCGQAPCHDAAQCPPCRSSCSVRCSHSECSLACSNPCAACAHACVWTCTCSDARQCLLPCGSPCVRLPCDSRCSRTLSCGHRCPSICGEPCPPPMFCVECARNMAVATAHTRAQVVDMITMAELKDLDLTDSEALLIVPACMHAYTVSTMDRVAGISDYYTRDPVTGAWSGVKPLSGIDDNAKAPVCIACRAPVTSVRRYGRVVQLAQLRMLQRKWQISIQRDASVCHGKLATLDALLNQQHSVAPGQLRYELVGLQRRVNRIEQLSNNPPTKQVYEAEVTALAQSELADGTPAQLIRPLYVPHLIAIDTRLRELMIRLCVLCRAPASPEGLISLHKVCKALGRAEITHQRLQGLCKTAQCGKRASLGHSLLVQVYSRLFEELAEHRSAIPSSDPQYTSELIHVQRRCIDGIAAELPLLSNPQEKQAAAEQLERARRVIDGVSYQPVTDRERAAIFNAMAPEIGSGIGSFGGHWFTCPNGHPYSIGECGGAMEMSQCPECGAAVGGSSHRLAEGNQVAAEFRQFVRP